MTENVHNFSISDHVKLKTPTLALRMHGLVAEPQNYESVPTIDV